MLRSHSMHFWQRTLFVLCLFLNLSVFLNAYADGDFLEPEKAFQFSAKQVAPDKIEVHYIIADGYYMYHERFKFSAKGATIGQAIIPKGQIHYDETFEKDVETYRGEVTIQIPVLKVDPSSATWTLTSRGQGCSDKGLCYSPMDSVKEFKSADFSAGAALSASSRSDGGGTEAILKAGKLYVVIPLFIVIGLGLAFTPCMLPMVPILSSIIAGEGTHTSRHRGFVLSLSYSLGMALVYTSLGVAAGLAGEGLAATLQNPWVLGSFSALLVLFALSMFDVYHLQMPAFVQHHLAHASHRQKSGKMFGVFVMGAISALIVGPCVAAPLATTLLYISQTHNVMIGGVSLFSMATGMSIPLLLIGLSAGTLLPKAGKWMESVKHFFGVLMLAMALWLASPILPGQIEMAGWAVLLFGYGVHLMRMTGSTYKIFASAICLLGLIEVVGLANGGRDAFSPLASFYAPVQTLQFARVKSVQDLDQALAQAKSQGKSAVLDFYADWCVSCKEMEKFTFTDQKVRDKLSNSVLLQADVTSNDAQDKELLKRFQLFGPPGIIFFDDQTNERGRVIGFEKADKFAQSLSKYLTAAT